ncbi:phosphoribosyl-AMP cyclohydrolase [uncultured Desulfovibrio sp.]|uniref:phosphoribosyl-AMP cyclohydrolase n=1 Tax=uncultured Desulfovibrio sp. TaxID=167968 RepID=UPI0025D1CE61|nr:phosphoribosyl-AMP cyclohydrolase [uncultured Desulfovibrio sp.]
MSNGQETAAPTAGTLPGAEFAPAFGGGLLPAVVQDAASGEVLMLAWMNEEAWRRTLESGEAHFWSRSRRELWHKGSTSGHVQRVRAVRLDCDSDAILLLVEQAGGAACHTGHRTCFFREWRAGALAVCAPMVFDPAAVYGAAAAARPNPSQGSDR